jgi:hypothetical protein
VRVSLAEPAGQKLPGVVHERQLAADVKAAPPVEKLPAGHAGSAPAAAAPGQKLPAGHVAQAGHAAAE